MTSNAVLKGIKSAWIDLLKPGNFNGYDQFVSNLKSANADEDYFIAANHPGIKQLIDGINFDEMQDYKLTVDNIAYYNAIKEDRYRIEDSKEYLSNSIELKLKNIADELVDYDSKLVQDMLLAGSTEAASQLGLSVKYAFDNVAYFSTYRNIPGSSTISNKYTLTCVASTGDQANFEADWKGAKSQLLDMKEANGKPINANPTLICLVPPNLEVFAKQTLNKEMTLSAAGGVLKSNVYAGDAQVIVNWGLAGSTQYRIYVINARRKDVAMIQDRMAAEWFTDDDQKNSWIGWYYKFRKGAALLNPFSCIRVST